MAAHIVLVDISNTVGQSSAIEANGGPIFEIEVTHEPRIFTNSITGEFDCEILGFGRVVSGGPVNGYEVGFLTGSVI